MNIRNLVLQKAILAKEASKILSNLSTNVKNELLFEVMKKINTKKEEIIKANQKDIEAAKNKGLSLALIDRLTLDTKRIDAMISILKEVAQLKDPLGEIEMWKRPNGLEIGRVKIPYGVIGIIYESRPNVTIDTFSLCLKSGNCVILRGGSEAINSNLMLVEIINETIYKLNLPAGILQFIEITDRSAIYELIKLDNYIDIIIPRGSKQMIIEIRKKSKIPVISHSEGICHIYVDNKANFEKGWKICLNAKIQRPSVCNAMETLLVHKDIAKSFLEEMIKLYKKSNVELRGCPKVLKLFPELKKATLKDWQTEYLDLILSIKIVENEDEAIEHINTYSSHLSEAIITEDYSKGRKFLREIDSAAVYINASTRFTDGNEFGLGAEIGISTQKLGGLGPMGLEELTTTKFIIYGDGQIRK